jgi:hypothetical protein
MINILFSYLRFKWSLWSCVRNDELYLFKYCLYYFFVNVYFIFYIIIYVQQHKNNINWDKIVQKTFEKIKFTIMDMWPQESLKSKVWAKSNSHLKF